MTDLLQEIEDFTRQTGMAESTLGKKAVNDGKFVAEKKNGRRSWPETDERVREFMRTYLSSSQ